MSHKVKDELLLAIIEGNVCAQQEILKELKRIADIQEAGAALEAHYLKHISFQLHEVLKLIPHPRTVTAALAFGGHMAAVPGTQAVGSTLTATFVPIEADGVTQTPGSTLTQPPTFTISDATIATIVDNGNGTATITGVAAGTVTVTATGGVFTDADGVATGPLDATNDDTVTSVTPPTGRTVTAQINFA